MLFCCWHHYTALLKDFTCEATLCFLIWRAVFMDCSKAEVGVQPPEASIIINGYKLQKVFACMADNEQILEKEEPNDSLLQSTGVTGRALLPCYSPWAEPCCGISKFIPVWVCSVLSSKEIAVWAWLGLAVEQKVSNPIQIGDFPTAFRRIKNSGSYSNETLILTWI